MNVGADRAQQCGRLRALHATPDRSAQKAGRISYAIIQSQAASRGEINVD
jgi:hypothetical protein